jgi:alpha-tubulin suppressor-like RCC1 family protein
MRVATLQNEKIIDFVCGEATTIALSESGMVFGWGLGITRVGTDDNEGSINEMICPIPQPLASILIM